jgi:hypothetical protein
VASVFAYQNLLQGKRPMSFKCRVFLLYSSAYTVDDLGTTVGKLIFFCFGILFLILYYKRMMSRHLTN